MDEAVRLLSQSVDQIKAQQQSESHASAQDLASLSGTVTAHTGNSGIHVTAAEKAAWSGVTDFQVGSYQGTGTSTQKITLGFKPRFGLVFPAGDGIARVSWPSSQLLLTSGFFSQLGCSLGITLNSDGFTVEHLSIGASDGNTEKYNISGTKYVYVVWK